MVLFFRFALGIGLTDIIVALIPESYKILRVQYFTLSILINMFTIIAIMRVSYNTRVYWVVFFSLECLVFSTILKNLFFVLEYLPMAYLIF